MSPSARTPRRGARSRREQGLAGGLGGLIGGRGGVDGARGRRVRTRGDRWHGDTMELHAVAIGGERRTGGSTGSSREPSLWLQAGALLERGLGFRIAAEAAGAAKTRRRATGATRTRRRATGEARRRTASRSSPGGQLHPVLGQARLEGRERFCARWLVLSALLGGRPQRCRTAGAAGRGCEGEGEDEGEGAESQERA